MDIGGTNVDIGIVGLDGRVLATAHTPTLRPEGPAACVARAAAKVEEAIRQSGLARTDILGLGIGCPGPLDLKAGKMHDSPNFPAAWQGYPLKDELARATSLPTAMDNDANAAALGEGWIGAAKGCPDFLVLTLGTGVGGGAVCDGRIIRGSNGCGAELGHVCVYPDGRPCGCGRHGCLESYASATALAAMAREENLGELSARQIFGRAASGDATASAIIARAGESLGIAIGTLLNVFNPELVVLAGGLAASFGQLQPHIEKQSRAHSYDITFAHARVCASTLVGQAGLIGAAAVFAYERNQLAG